MKIFTSCILVVLFAGFSSCENHMDINDVTKGTPSKADTVMPHKFSPHNEADTTKTTELPTVFKR